MEEEQTTERGTVLRVDGNSLLVRVRRAQAAACEGCRSCSLNKLCKGRETGRMDLHVAAPEGKRYAPGDELTVAYRQANAAVAAGVMFVPPLIGLALGGWAGSGFGDGALVAGCAIGFALGAGLSWAISRKSNTLKPQAWVVTEA